MNDEALYSEWFFWLIIAAVLIVAAAALLIIVLVLAKRILRLAVAALGIVTKVKENTMPIWDLQTTNEVAIQILNGAKDIKDHTKLVASNLPKNDN